MAFKIHNFWPNDPDMWFQLLEFRLCRITNSQTKFDHTLEVLPTEVCNNITGSLRDIDESADDTCKQLKALLVSKISASG